MTNKPGNIAREEALAIVCSLLMTTILCLYALHVKQQEEAGRSIVSLVEYAESFSIPRKQSNETQRKAGKGKREVPSPENDVAPQVVRERSSSRDTTDLTVSHLTSTPDSLTEKGSRIFLDSANADLSPVFRPFNRSRELDSILMVQGAAGISLLRAHLFHENQTYDTLRTNHLIRLGVELARFEASQNLENDMKRNVRRYGTPYNPLRPQPPSGQIELGGFVSWLLGYLYSSVEEVPAALTRAVKPRDKKAPE